MGGQMGDVIRVALDSSGELVQPVPYPLTTLADTDARPEGIGQDLFKARQRSGKMLMDVWRDLKILPHYLIAIEKSRFEALPGRVYAIGYVRTYARYLGLDAEAFVARLKLEISGIDAWKPPIRTVLPPPDRKSAPEGEFVAPADAEEIIVSPPPSHGSALAHAATAALLGTVLIYFGYQVFVFSQRAALPPVTPVPARLAANAGLTTKKPPAPQRIAKVDRAPLPAAHADVSPSRPVDTPRIATTDSPARTPASTASAEVTSAKPADAQPLAMIYQAPTWRDEPLSPSDVARTESIPATILASVEPPPPPLPKPRPRKDEPAKPQVVIAEPAPNFRAPLPLGQRYGVSNKDSRIILRLHRTTHVIVQGFRNDIFIDRVLDAGDTYRVPNMTGLKLTVPDAGAVELIVDDTTVGFAGKDGTATRGLVLDPNSIIDRQR